MKCHIALFQPSQQAVVLAISKLSNSIANHCAAGESLGQALDRAFAERIKLPKGDDEHAGAPIQDTRAAPIPSPPSSPSSTGQAGEGRAAADGEGQAEGSAKAEGSVKGPTETSAAGIAQAGHEETDAVDPSMSSAAMHSAGPTGMSPSKSAPQPPSPGSSCLSTLSPLASFVVLPGPSVCAQMAGL